MNSETVIISTRGNNKIKNKPTVNKQISTNDPIEEEVKQEKIVEIERPKTNDKIISKLERLKEKTSEYTNKLNSIEKQIIIEKNSSTEEINEINEELKEKDIDIKKLADDNKILYNELRNIKDEVDDKMKIIRIIKLKENELLKTEERLNKDIKVSEKEIIITTRNIEIYKKEKDNLEKLLKNNNENKQYNLNLKLQSLNLERENLEKEIKDDKTFMKEHKFCEKKKQKLQNKLNIIRNELEFEKKKLNMNEQRKNDENKYSDDLNIDDINKKSRILNRTEIQSPGKKLKKKEPTLQKTTTPIWKELEIAHKKYLKSISNRTAKQIFENKIQDERSKFGLFSPKEVEILSKLIPNDFLEIYQQRYDNVEMQKQEIEEQILYGNSNVKQEIKENKHKIDKSNLKMKEQNIKTGKLNEDLSKLKRLGNECNNEIKIINEHLKNLSLVYKQKIGENQRLKDRINEIKSRIKKGELIQKFTIEKKDNESIIPNKKENEEKENENEENENEEEENDEDDSNKDINDSNFDINNKENLIDED